MSSTLVTNDSNNLISASWKRLIWKERRELMPVWVGIILIAVFGLAMLAFQASIPCLLYTSPSPRDGLLSRMPSSA